MTVRMRVSGGSRAGLRKDHQRLSGGGAGRRAECEATAIFFSFSLNHERESSIQQIHSPTLQKGGAKLTKEFALSHKDFA